MILITPGINEWEGGRSQATWGILISWFAGMSPWKKPGPLSDSKKNKQPIPVLIKTKSGHVPF